MRPSGIRLVLVIDDHDLSEFILADPAGDGLTKFTEDELVEAWTLGAKKEVLWAGSVWVRNDVSPLRPGRP